MNRPESGQPSTGETDGSRTPEEFSGQGLIEASTDKEMLGAILSNAGLDPVTAIKALSEGE